MHRLHSRKQPPACALYLCMIPAVPKDDTNNVKPKSDYAVEIAIAIVGTKVIVRKQNNKLQQTPRHMSMLTPPSTPMKKNALTRKVVNLLKLQLDFRHETALLHVGRHEQRCRWLRTSTAQEKTENDCNKYAKQESQPPPVTPKKRLLLVENCHAFP